MAALKLDFSLSKVGADLRRQPAPEVRTAWRGHEETVPAGPDALSLARGRTDGWTSRWAGKRHWWNIRWHLVEAARQMTVKGGPLGEILFVPEPFRAADKTRDRAEAGRGACIRSAFEERSAKADDPRRRGQGASRRHGSVINSIVKHLPGFVFLLDESLHRRLQARFENETRAVECG